MMPGGDSEEEGDDTGGGDTAKFFGWLLTAVVLHEVAMNCMFVVSRCSIALFMGTWVG